jgi:hypothetical protein
MMGKIFELDQVTGKVYSVLHDYLSCSKYNAAVQVKGVQTLRIYEACRESKDTKALNIYNPFNLQFNLPKRHCI